MVSEDQASYIGIQGASVSSDEQEKVQYPGRRSCGICSRRWPGSSGWYPGRGHIITELDGRSVSSIEGLQDTLQYYAAGETVDIVVQRADNGSYQEQTLSITLGSAQDAETNN